MARHRLADLADFKAAADVENRLALKDMKDKDRELYWQRKDRERSLELARDKEFVQGKVEADQRAWKAEKEKKIVGVL